MRRDYSPFQPNALWSGDWHRADFRILYRGRWVRPWLCVWLDFGPRLVAGWHLAARADTDGLLAGFAEAAIQHGAPLGLVIDNGWDFSSPAFAGQRERLSEADCECIKGVCGALGVAVHFCWPFNPGSKPIESFFRTLTLHLARAVPTYCEGSPAQRPPELEGRLRRAEVDPFTLEDASGLIRTWIEEVYHRTLHSGEGMGGRTPLEAFADNPIAKRTAPMHVLEHLLRKPTKVRCGRRGVRYNNVYYHCYLPDGTSPLLPFIGRDVQVRANFRGEDDAATVEVFDLAGRRICTASNCRLDGTTVEQIKELRRRQRGARRQVAEAVALMKTVTTPLDVQAVVAAQARYAAEQSKGRAVIGAAASSRPLQLLPGAANLIDQLPPPRTGRAGRTEAPSLLDTLEIPEREPVEWVAPIDLAPMPGELGDVLSSAEPRGTDASDPLDELPDLPDPADEWADNGAHPDE